MSQDLYLPYLQTPFTRAGLNNFQNSNMSLPYIVNQDYVDNAQAEGVYSHDYIQQLQQQSYMPELEQARISNLNAQTANANSAIKARNDYLNSAEYKYLKPFATGVQALSSLSNIYLGFQQIGLAKKQLGIAQSQWNEQKQELNHIREVRNNLTKKYMGQ